ncbi:MAG: phospho-sugar mutase [Bacillota bacterium]|nr:phospho-sugar mutase [Bacillota bacterium]
MVQRDGIDRLQDVLVAHPAFEAWLANPDVPDHLRLEAILEVAAIDPNVLLDPATGYTELALTPLLAPYEELATAISDAYDSRLVFGTAGLRERRGPGFRRMNAYTVAVAAESIALWLKQTAAEGIAAERPVVIGYDTRHQSREFAELSAWRLALHGIRVEITQDWCATPLVAYAVRPRRALAGIMLTASHNDASYSGLKLYTADGIQAADSVTAAIAREMAVPPRLIDGPDYEACCAAHQIRFLPAGVEQAYLAGLRAELPRRGGEEAVRILWSAMLGTGSRYLPPLMEKLGYSAFEVYEPERGPDPDFGGIPRPNPEYAQTMAPVMAAAAERGMDLVLATDPDADRLAVAIPDREGRLHHLDGNQTGALLVDFLLRELERRGTLPERPVLVKTIVTDDFGRRIAAAAGVRTLESLTGFKNICGRIRDIRALEPPGEFICGYEESIGYALGTAVLDKDGIQAACWMAAACRDRLAAGSSLWERLMELEARHGVHLANPRELVREGPQGAAAIDAIMQRFRNPACYIRQIAGHALTLVEDYASGERRRVLAPGEADGVPSFAIEKMNFERSNVLRFFYGEDISFAIRPSGTEPKIKIYEYVRHPDRTEAGRLARALAACVSVLLEGPGEILLDDDEGEGEAETGGRRGGP